MEQQYNGYYNYETWCVKLWLDNDEQNYNYLMNVEVSNCNELEQVIEQLIENTEPDVQGLWGDLIEHIKSKINTYEIAECFWKDRGEKIV